VGNPNRYQEAEPFVSQTDLTLKFDTGGRKHTVVAGLEVAREDLSLCRGPTTPPPASRRDDLFNWHVGILFKPILPASLELLHKRKEARCD
jgi:outer membrane receptor for monomeric catechols